MLLNSIMRSAICCCLLLSSLKFSFGLAKKDDLPNCQPGHEVTANLTEASGTLKTPTDSLNVVSNCVWKIELNDTNAAKASLTFFIKHFKLEENDSLTIIYNEKNKSGEKIDGKLSFKSESIFLTGIPVNYVVTITLNTTTKKANDRLFEIVYDYTGNIPYIVNDRNEQNALSILHAQTKFTVNDVDITYQLSPAIKDAYQLVIAVYESTLNSSAEFFSFSETKNDKSDFSHTLDDMIAGDKNEVKISVNGFALTAPVDQRLILHYTLYDKACVYYQKDMDNVHAFAIPTSDRLDSINCLFFIKSTKAGYMQLDYGKFNFINNLDTLTVRKGNRLTSPITSIINKESFNLMKNNYLNIIQNANIHVTYNCLSTKSDAVNPIASSLVVTPFYGDGGIYRENFNSKISSATNNTYIFIGNNDSGDLRAVMNSNQTNQILSAGEIRIYDNLHVGDKTPLLKIKAGQLLPQNIWSNTNILRLQMMNVTMLDFGVNMTKNKLNSVADDKNSVKVITAKQLNCNESVTWLIPALDETKMTEKDQYVYLFHIPFIALNSSNDCVELYELNKTRTLLTTICGDDSLPLIDQSIPSIMLHSTVMYEVVYKRGHINCNLKDKSALFQFSLMSNLIENFQHFYSLQLSKKSTIAPNTYPNNYAIRDKTLSTICRDNNACGSFIIDDRNTSKTSKLIGHVKFLDLDLAPGHSLFLKFATEDPQNLTNNSTLPYDYIIDNLEFIQLDSAFKNKYNVANEKISGRGFKLDVDTYDCGMTVKSKASHGNLTTATIIDGTRCMWIIDGRVKGMTDRVLNFTMNFLNASHVPGAKEGKLSFYDSPTMRDPVLLDFLKNRTYNSASVNRTIIVYEKIDNESKLIGLNITWKLDECLFYCDNNTRCILPEWRCDNRSHCSDGGDQTHCNSSSCPKPKPEPSPSLPKAGVNGWVIAFVIIPLSMIIGALIARFGPVVVRRFRGGTYQEFSSLSDVN